MDYAIELKGVGMDFGAREESEVLLKSANLQIKKGETFVFIGPSGEGKSTLLKIMGGIQEPTSGEVLIYGDSMYKTNEKQRLKSMQKMGMLFQKNALFDSLSVSENIAFPLREVKHASEAEISSKVEYFLKAVGIFEAKDLFPDEISGGMQKRLGIARALVLDPEIIFYDDPTAGLDPITSKIIVELIIELREKRGATVVAVTNDMNRAYQLADRIGFIVDGELIVTGNKKQTLEFDDKRVHQFVRGLLEGPLTETTAGAV